jgi:lipase
MGQPVICLHGVSGHGRRFRRLAEERLQGYRVVGVDYRGHGRSGWEPPWSVEQHVADLLETADDLGIAEAAWVGHSFGGKLVAEVAARHPDRVACAVLLDPAMQLDARLTDGSVFTTPREMLEEEAREHLVESPDGRYRWQYAPAAVIVAWSEMASTTPPWPRCPTLVVCGERSWIPVVVPRNGHITRVDVPGGHSVLWDDFDATADAIVQFLS